MKKIDFWVLFLHFLGKNVQICPPRPGSGIFPDYREIQNIERIKKKSSVLHLGINLKIFDEGLTLSKLIFWRKPKSELEKMTAKLDEYYHTRKTEKFRDPEIEKWIKKNPELKAENCKCYLKK